jgi:signal peptidase II
MVAAFHPGEERPYTSFFSLILTFNAGAAFSLFADADGWQRWFFAVIAVGAAFLITWLLKRGGSAMYCLGLALILGGALGNVWDRLTIGRVIDFLLFHYERWSWPAFNVADSAICVGAALLIVDSFRQRRAADPPRVSSEGRN